jgi:LemA protein
VVEVAAAEAAARVDMNIERLIIITISSTTAIWGVLTYNRLVTLRNRCSNAWSQIEVLLKKRYELIPKLVSIVRQYASHETETLEKVTSKRAAALAASGPRDAAGGENDLDSALKSLFAVVEDYPELKADGLFLNLQKDLAGIEDDIRFSRQFYNDTVMIYNTSIDGFPNLLISRIARFEDREYFEASVTVGR